jgi:hypothetical protein
MLKARWRAQLDTAALSQMVGDVDEGDGPGRNEVHQRPDPRPLLDRGKKFWKAIMWERPSHIDQALVAVEENLWDKE